jgi:hypothetical protein
MRIVKSLVVMAMFLVLTCAFWDAQQGRRGRYGSTPNDVFDTVVGGANRWLSTRIQDTKLNQVTDNDGGYAREMRISNTLDSIRLNIWPYMQRAMYLWLSAAVIIIIYNGFLLVAGNLTGEDLAKVRDRIINVLLGVGVLTWFYFLIRIVVALVSQIAL